MCKLTPDEVWTRIQALEGTPVFTVDRHEKNFVERVTPIDVKLVKDGRERSSSPRRGDIIAAYDRLWRCGIVTGDDFEKGLILPNSLKNA